MSEVIYRHRLPFSTLAVAEAENPILKEGEVWTEKHATTGFSTGRRKVGDGVTEFEDLPFEPAASSTATTTAFTPAGTIAATNVQAAIEELDGDARMSNSRTPTTHAASHGDGGSDEITIAQDQVTGLGTALSGKEAAGAAAAAVSAHEGAADPHPGYLTQTEGDGRYRQASTALTDGDIPAGIARDSEVTAAISAHEGAADPHPGYLTAAEGNAAYAALGHVGSGGGAHANAVASGAAGFLTGADKAKLDGVASGATANATDSALRDRATHTGTQAAGTITGLATVATTGAYGDLSGRPTLGTAAAAATGDFAPAAQGVTNGNSHDHNGGDGAQIAYSSLSGLPTLGSLAALSALGSITSAGAIGSTANLPIITGTAGALQVGSFGTTANTFAQGNDSRFHDSVTLGASVSPVFNLTGQALGAVDHGADRLLFWDDSAGTLAPLTLGTNLTITGTTLDATGGGGLTAAAVVSRVNALQLLPPIF